MQGLCFCSFWFSGAACFQSRDADSDTGGGVNTSGHVQRQTRPLILPDKFSGVEDFSEWTAHFNSVSVINGWSDDDK